MITQKEIAEKLGVSRTTVARAINGSGNIKEATKKKILDLVNETNYQKNYVGSSLASKMKKIYVFIVKSKNLFYTEQIKKGIKKIKDEYKYYNFQVEEIYTEIDNPEEQVKNLKEILSTGEKIDGILITPLDKKEIYLSLKPYLDEIKVVSMSIELNKNILYVGPDYLKEGRIAANIISKILRENEKLLIIDNGDDNISSGYYLKGFIDKISEDKLEILGPFKKDSIEDSVDFLNNILEEKEIDSIYINRYAQDILKKIPLNKLKNKKIIINGIGNGIRKLIKEQIIIGTVADDVYKTGYMAGRIIFEMLYKGKKNKKDRLITEPRIIFLENLD